MTNINYILALTPLVALIIYREIKLHASISKIETDITWIKRELNKCPPTSDKDTP